MVVVNEAAHEAEGERGNEYAAAQNLHCEDLQPATQGQCIFVTHAADFLHHEEVASIERSKYKSNHIEIHQFALGSFVGLDK